MAGYFTITLFVTLVVTMAVTMAVTLANTLADTLARIKVLGVTPAKVVTSKVSYRNA